MFQSTCFAGLMFFVVLQVGEFYGDDNGDTMVIPLSEQEAGKSNTTQEFDNYKVLPRCRATNLKKILGIRCFLTVFWCIWNFNPKICFLKS